MTGLYEYKPADYGNQEMHPAMVRAQIKASKILTEVKSVKCKEGVHIIVKTADELSAGDETILDEIIAAYDDEDYQKDFVAKLINNEELPSDYLEKRLTVSSTASGLVITTTIDELDVDDETTVEADSSLEKSVLISLCYNGVDGFYIAAFEKTDGLYSLEDEEDNLAQDISEWTDEANGDTLSEVE